MHTSALIEYSGTLLDCAQARTRLVGDQSVPVLVMDVALDNALHNILHVEQPFHPQQYPQACAAARRLKKGTRVTVQAPLLDLHLVARNAAHIHVVHDDAIPTPATEPTHG